MKKALFLIIMSVPLLALAQAVPEVSPSLLDKLKNSVGWLMLANGGLTLVRFLAGYIPVIGPYIQKLLDVFMANPAHPVSP